MLETCGNMFFELCHLWKVILLINYYFTGGFFMKRKFKLSISTILIFVVLLTNVLTVFPQGSGILNTSEVVVEGEVAEQVVEEVIETTIEETVESIEEPMPEEVSEEISEPTEESMSQQEFLIMEHKELSSTEIKNNLTLNEDTEFEHIYIYSGVINLNGYSLIVKGNLIQSGGTVKINGGQLIVEGDYRIQKESVSDDGTATYSGGKGNLDMTNEEDYVLVNSDFVMQSYNNHSNYLKAGVLEVKGDFTQKRGSGSRGYTNNFRASGTHKTILNGNKLQIISFENAGDSRFNVLEIKNNAGQQVEYTNDLAVNTLITNGLELPPITVNPTDWKLTGNEVVNGNLYIKGSVVDLNGYSLTVRGNLIV